MEGRKTFAETCRHLARAHVESMNRWRDRVMAGRTTYADTVGDPEWRYHVTANEALRVAEVKR